jgi:hypothetical protein
VVGAPIDVRIGDDYEHALRRTFHKTARGFEDCDAGSFGTYQGSRYVKTVFGEQVIQVVAGDSAGNVGEPLAD